mgnify:CR=1 FL=1
MSGIRSIGIEEKSSRVVEIILSSLKPFQLMAGKIVGIAGTGLTMVNNTVPPGNVSLSFAQIPAGQQAVIELRARVANNASANAGTSFTNTVGYTYAITAGGASIVGGSATTPTSLTIIEPLLSMNKSVVNMSNAGNPPVAGDLLRCVPYAWRELESEPQEGEPQDGEPQEGSASTDRTESGEQDEEQQPQGEQQGQDSADGLHGLRS